MQRSQILHNLSKTKKMNFYKKNIGSVKNILIEECNEGILSGLADNYICVKTRGIPEEVNTIIPLQMMDIQRDEMIGQRIN